MDTTTVQYPWWSDAKILNKLVAKSNNALKGSLQGCKEPGFYIHKSVCDRPPTKLIKNCISLDAEKAFHRIQHPFIRTQQIGYKGKIKPI